MPSLDDLVGSGDYERDIMQDPEGFRAQDQGNSGVSLGEDILRKTNPEDRRLFSVEQAAAILQNMPNLDASTLIYNAKIIEHYLRTGEAPPDPQGTRSRPAGGPLTASEGVPGVSYQDEGSGAQAAVSDVSGPVAMTSDDW